MYCVLWGTLLLDYDNEDDAKANLSPKVAVEVVGVSEWDGKGRANSYPGGLLFVTHTGGNYYVSCTSLQERDEWIMHVRKALECIFANQEIAPFKPSKIIQNRPQPVRNLKCPKTDTVITAYSPICRSCGRQYNAAEHVAEPCVMLQLGSEEAEKVCSDCKSAQLCIYWFKTVNYAHAMDLHELTPSVVREVGKYKASFRLRRRLSQRLEMAAELFEAGNLNREEFEELRSVDHAYRRELQHEECLKLKQAMEAFGEDMQTLINVLMNPAMTAKGGRSAYFVVILRILELADQAPDLVDFYFPQLYQIHLQQLLDRSSESYLRVDCLQQALLVLAQKYSSFGLKLAWSLIATLGDFQEKKVTQVQFAACMCLLLQLEMVTTGHISAIADVPTSKLLHKLLTPAIHQQQEIGFEISALFLVRRRLQEAYDAEEAERKARNDKLYGAFNPDIAFEKEEMEKKNRPLPLFPGSNYTCSSVDLLYQLGVGQEASRSHYDENNSSETAESPLGEKSSSSSVLPQHYWEGFSQQLDFLGRVNGLVDSLRNVDRPLRSETFKEHVQRWNRPRRRKHSPSNNGTISGSMSRSGSHGEQLHVPASHHPHHSSNGTQEGKRSDTTSTDTNTTSIDHSKDDGAINMLGWDPTTVAGEPQYRITRIITEECRVFRTKARAPTLILCEVMRDDLYVKYHLNPSGLQAEITRSNAAFVAKNVQQLTLDDVVVDAEQHQEATVSHAKAAAGHHHHHSNSSGAGKKIEHTTSIGSTHSNHATHEALDQAVTQSLHDVDKLLGSALTSTISEMKTSSQQQSASHQQDDNVITAAAVVEEEASTKSSTKSTFSSKIITDLANSSNNNSGTNSPGPNPLHLPRRKSGCILPTNRLASSTEGILRSSQMGFSSSGSLMQQQQQQAKMIKSGFHGNNLNGSSSSNVVASSGGMKKSGSSTALPDLPPPPTVVMSEGGGSDSGSETNDTNTNMPIPPSGVRDDVSVVSSRSSVTDGRQSQATNEIKSGPATQKQVLTSAQRLLQEGIIDQKEYDMLLQSDAQYREEVAREEQIQIRTRVETVLGESFHSKKERILGEKYELSSRRPSLAAAGSEENLPLLVSEHENKDGSGDEDSFWPAYDLRSFIVKTNDDLRQEICCLQLMQICKEIFDHFGLGDMLYLRPYRIICTGYMSGVVEVLPDAMSLDGLKRTKDFTTLNAYFTRVYSSSNERLQQAKYNFMSSLAAYSLFCYLLQIKDRHNGNLLIDSEGHILHIDFGFLLSIAPGGSFSVETAPFKLTEEMVDLLGGLDSPLFGDFVTAFTKGFIALQANCENILAAITVLSHNSSFPCFVGKPVGPILEKLHARFRTELNVSDAVKHCLDLITNSYGHYGTRQYDTFQYYSNGILP